MSPPLSDAQAAKVERHAGMVRATARRIAKQVGERQLSIDELESVGNEALVQAAMRYDPNSGASFATYAHYRVYGAMIDALRKRTPALRNRKRRLTRLAATTALLEQAAEDQAGYRRAGQQQTLEQRIEAARELVRRASVALRLTESDPNRFEAVAAEQPDPEERLLDEDQRRLLWSLVAELDGHERELIEAVYGQGLTMSEYAKEIGTSPATISRRHARIVDRLARRARVIVREQTKNLGA